MLDQGRGGSLDPDLQGRPAAALGRDQADGLGAPGERLADDLTPARLKTLGASAETRVQGLDQP